jgi:flagellar hook-associated protein 3 FlgL
MASGVSDIGTQLSREFLLRSLRQDVTSLERQASTGKKSETIAGLGTQGASNAIGYRNRINMNQAFTENLESAKVQFTVMDKSMESITEMGRDILSTLRKQLQGAAPQAVIISNEAKVKLDTIIRSLNEQVNGRYVFAGDNIYDQPLSNPVTLNANMAAQVAGWLAGAPTVASVISDAQTVVGTGVGYNPDLLTAGNVSFRGDVGFDVTYTTTGNLPGFADVLRGAAIISNLPQPTTAAEQANYWTVVNGVISMVENAVKEIDVYQGMLGVQASTIDDLIVRHEESSATFQEFVGSVEDADLADVSIRIQAIRTQLEASYNIVSLVRNLSLVNYL